MKSANNFALPKPKTGIALPANDAIPTDLLIGDTWREGTGGSRIPVLNPSGSKVEQLDHRKYLCPFHWSQDN